MNSFAKNSRKTPKTIPDNILIIIAVPRSGSTWLLDALRSHPAISMPVRGMIYQSLNLHGRRYPRDLSDGPEASIKMEVRPDMGKWANIPDFTLKLTDDQRKLLAALPHYAVEKIHPHFFDHNVSEFISKIGDLGPSIQFRVLYLIRNPEDTLKSFFHYQTRNPDWNRNKSPGDVVVHMAAIYNTIFNMVKNFPGKIVDYLDLLDQPEQIFGEVLAWLWPDIKVENSPDIQLITSLMNQATKREKRARGQSFFGSKTSSFFDGKTFGKLIQTSSKEFQLCRECYQQLLGLKSE